MFVFWHYLLHIHIKRLEATSDTAHTFVKRLTDVHIELLDYSFISLDRLTGLIWGFPKIGNNNLTRTVSIPEYQAYPFIKSLLKMVIFWNPFCYHIFGNSHMSLFVVIDVLIFATTDQAKFLWLRYFTRLTGSGILD